MPFHEAATDAAATAATPCFVAYYRVSTNRQGRSGLGLDAQRAAVAKYVAGADGVVAAEFEEVESGTRNDRPQLAAALAACRAALVIAKLDLRSRNARFLPHVAEGAGSEDGSSADQETSAVVGYVVKPHRV